MFNIQFATGLGSVAFAFVALSLLSRLFVGAAVALT